METNFCGTMKGYRIHLRDKTSICEECRLCYNKYKRTLRRAKNKETNVKKFPQTNTDSNTNEPQENEPNATEQLLFKKIQDLKENLAYIKDGMREATPRELPALSKRRQELEENIFILEKQTLIKNMEQTDKSSILHRVQRINTKT